MASLRKSLLGTPKPQLVDPVIFSYGQYIFMRAVHAKVAPSSYFPVPNFSSLAGVEVARLIRSA